VSRPGNDSGNAPCGMPVQAAVEALPLEPREGAPRLRVPLRAIDNRSMSSSFLWVKALHIVFIASWFAGLFYLPRIFVNLVSVPADSHAERERLLLMARKLYRFSSLLMIPAIGLGLVLWWVYGVGKGPGQYWLHAKALLVVGALGYHHACRSLLRRFEQFSNARSERWFRVFNEAAVLIFALIVILVVVKPF
jgi:putative membrane protein